MLRQPVAQAKKERWYWPKAESLLYEECKKLARLGVATVHRTATYYAPFPCGGTTIAGVTASPSG